MIEIRRYIRNETAVSMAINAVLSAAFTGLIFGRRAVVAPDGAGGYAVDFVVQSFIVILMSTLVPSLITHARLKSGKLAWAQGARPGKPPWPRALLVATVGAVVLGGAAAAASFLAGAQPIAVLLVVKTVYGALLALAFTPLALRATLAAGFRTAA
jgi:hypothetical protein